MPRCGQQWSTKSDVGKYCSHKCAAGHATHKASHMLDLREQQLADCTRAMREVAAELLYIVGGEDGVENVDPGEAREIAAKLNAVRGGNRCDACGKSLPWDEVSDERLWASSGVCNQDCAVRAGKAGA